MRVIFQFECVHCGRMEESVQSLHFDTTPALWSCTERAERLVDAASDAVREVAEVFPDAQVGGDCLTECAACRLELDQQTTDPEPDLLERTDVDLAFCEEQAEDERDDEDYGYGYTEAERAEVEAEWAAYCKRQKIAAKAEIARIKALRGYVIRARKEARAIKRAKSARRFEFWGDLDTPYAHEAEETEALKRARARDNDLQNRWNDRVGHAWAKNKRNVESRSMDRAKAKRRKVGPWLLNP